MRITKIIKSENGFINDLELLNVIWNENIWPRH